MVRAAGVAPARRRRDPVDLEGHSFVLTRRASHPEDGVINLSQYVEPGWALQTLENGPPGRGYLLEQRVGDRAEQDPRRSWC